MKWEEFYLELCNAYAKKSPCLSRQVGAILVRDKTIISAGYNGPPRGFPHCEGECPRKLKESYKSGEGLDICYAAHAERNCIINAAREGVVTKNSTLYLNTEVLPCKDCAIEIINAGIILIVALGTEIYDKSSQRLYAESGIAFRTFYL